EDPWLAENVVGDMEDLPCRAPSCPRPSPRISEGSPRPAPRPSAFCVRVDVASRARRPCVHPGAPHEFLLPRRWLLHCTVQAGFVIREARGCRIGMGVLRRVGLFAGESPASSGQRTASVAA